METLDVGGDLMRCTVEQAGEVCRRLREGGLQHKGLPITGVGHGPRAWFRWLRVGPLEVFREHFDNHRLFQEGKYVFEQVVVVRAVRLLGCSLRRHVQGYRPQAYVERLLLQRPHPAEEEAGLQQAVLQSSRVRDFAPCLVYADYLEEHGVVYLAARFRGVEEEAIR